MNIIDIINKKRLGKILTKEEIKYIITGYVDGTIPDYQMSSLLMAIVLNGMTDHEIITITEEMLKSGEKLDLSTLGTVVDKHSTGGVGDKTTMIIAPMVASCGVKVAKMSGRGLGHTGGTIDKLESIPGFEVNMDTTDFFEQVNEIGMAIVSQTNNLVPADKKIYSLRDVTGTVESIPLIASSIMSKKIASGANKLVIDVKVGNGALIKNLKDAQKLSNLMIQIGAANGIEVICLLTNMDIPLGKNIGNALEVKEAMEILRGNSQNNLTELSIELSSYMVSLGLSISYEEAKNKVLENFQNGNAYKKFIEFVHAQKGDLSRLPETKYQYEIKSTKTGYLSKINALELGKLSMHLGAGRESLQEEINYGAGIVLTKKIGDYIEEGDNIMTLYTDKEFNQDDIPNNIYTITTTKPEIPTLIYQVLK